MTLAKNKPSRQLKIDHVTIAGPSLARLEAALARVGLVTDYGGPHSNGITHMSLLGFDDGSYIELISFIEPGEYETAFWGAHIAGDAGPCAWAAQVDDVAGEAARQAALGVTVDGPHAYTRQRPDGELIEWDLAFPGDKSAGATLPFIIKDRTPRRLRVQPSDSVAGRDDQPALLTGVARVVLGVQNMPAAVELFQRVYGWPAPQQLIDATFGATLAHFSGTPVILATPLTAGNWLAQRLARFDDAPCAYLLGSRSLAAATTAYDLLPGATWFGTTLAWFNPDKLNGLRLGVIG